jgi:hypothetical protein
MAELQGPRQILLAAEGSIPSRGPTIYYIINKLSKENKNGKKRIFLLS